MTKVFIDAATSKHPSISACVAIIEDTKRHTFHVIHENIDNHEAEWESLILAMQKSIELQLTQLIIYTDAQIIVDTLDKGYTKNVKYKPYYTQYLALQAHFQLVFVSFVERKHNKHADSVAKSVLFQYKEKLRKE